MNKILFVVDNRVIGGVSILLEDILNNLSYSNYNIDVLVLNNNGDRFKNVPDNVKVLYGNKFFCVIDQDFKKLFKSFKFGKALKKLYFSYLMKTGKIIKYLSSIRKKMKLESYDIEIAFKAGFCSLFVAAGDAKVKYNWIHEDYGSYNRTKRYENTFKEVFKSFDKHITVSTDAMQSFKKIYPIQNEILVVDNLVDEDKIINLANKETKLDLACDKLKIISVGRFSYEKGYDRLLEAVNNIKESESLKDVIIYIVGYGDEVFKLKEYINSNKLDRLIKLIDNSDNSKNIYSMMRQSDVFILPSRSESFGMVRVEAMILGLPVITTNVGGTTSIIENNINGIVVENSTNGIQQGLLKVIENKALFNKLKQNVERFTYKEKNKLIIQKIENILEKKIG